VRRIRGAAAFERARARTRFGAHADILRHDTERALRSRIGWQQALACRRTICARKAR
jgi:hypothetical protein